MFSDPLEIATEETIQPILAQYLKDGLICGDVQYVVDNALYMTCFEYALKTDVISYLNDNVRAKDDDIKNAVTNLFNNIKQRHILYPKNTRVYDACYSADEDAVLHHLRSHPRLTMSMLEDSCAKIYSKISEISIKPNTYVGVIAAAAIVSSQTQSVMSSFHNAGRGNSFTSSISRMRDIIKCTSTDNNDEISVNLMHPMSDRQMNRIRKQLVHVTLSSILGGIYEIDDPQKSHYIRRYTFMVENLRELRITYHDILTKFQDLPGMIKGEVDHSTGTYPVLNVSWIMARSDGIDITKISEAAKILIESTVCGIPGITSIIEETKNSDGLIKSLKLKVYVHES
ncbi:hypothetical protein HDU86_000574 [Geranomyces michiganensis]|nr:hypothetical protein HDU86_000574 [Geranomyces michiganensis]